VVVAVSAEDAVAQAGMVLIAVADDALAPFCRVLAASETDWAGREVFHFSGRAGTEPLLPFARRGARVAALHPPRPFAGDTFADAAGLVGACIAVTAPNPAAAVAADALVRRLGGCPFTVTEAARPLYHAALTHAINHLVTLVAEASDLLRLAGVADPAAVLGPGAATALANALASGAAAATGPVVRGDAGTVAAHAAALVEAAPAVLPGYVAMTRAGLRLASEKDRIDPERARGVLAALDAAG